ncbi:MAG: hypothetical protein KIY11_02240 [Thermoplasmata archaeon]|nr:hypothetical protein [Candidatus Sysuiplasma acidicola]
MNKLTACMIAAFIVVSGLLVVFPTGNASAASASLTANNAYGTVQSRFTVDGALFYGVYNAPANTLVTMSLVNKTGGQTVSTQNFLTSSSGTYQSWVSANFQFFDLSGMPIGNYLLEASVAGTQIANTSLAVFYPVYSTSITMTLPNYNTVNRYVLSSDDVYAYTRTVDQFGNPMSGNTSAGLQTYFLTIPSNYSRGYTQFVGYYSPNDFGISFVHFPASSVFVGPGQYNLTAYFAGTPAGSSTRDPQTGSAVYFIINSQVTISPASSNNVYGQGLLLKFSGQFSPYNGNVNASIVSMQTGIVYFNLTNSAVNSGNWNASYYVNYSVPDGQYIFNVSEASNGYQFYSTAISFQAITIQAQANEQTYLPGEPASIYYTVTNTSNDAPVGSASVTYTLNYTNSGGKQSESGVVSGGVLNVQIPASANFRSVVSITLRATDQYGHNSQTTVDVGVNRLVSDVGTSSISYTPGEPVFVTVYAYVSGFRGFQSSPVSGATVYANISFSGKQLSAYSQKGLSTDGQGQTSFVIVFPSNASLGTYNINASTGAFGWNSISTTSFDLIKQTPQYTLVVVPSQVVYVSGGQFSAAWQLVTNGSAVTSATATYSASINGGAITAGTSSTGTIAFQLPQGQWGTMSLSVSAADAAGNQASTTLSVQVMEAMLVLGTSVQNYEPSQNVQVSYHVIGQGFSSPTYYYTITDAAGNTVMSGSTLKTSFVFTVPKTPSFSYTFEVIAANSTSGRTVSAYSSVQLLTGFQISFTISSSSYVTGTYASGQHITVYYRISTYQMSSSSPVYTIQIQVLGIASSVVSFTVTSTSGSLQYTLPSNLGNGNYIMSAFAVDGSGGISSAIQNFAVSNSEPVWNYNVVGGVSLGSVLWGLITLIAVGIALMAYTGHRLHMKGGEKKTDQKEQQPPESNVKEEEKK